MLIPRSKLSRSSNFGTLMAMHVHRIFSVYHMCRLESKRRDRQTILPFSSTKSFMSLASHILAIVTQILRSLGGSSSRNPGLHWAGNAAKASPDIIAIVVTDTRTINVELIIFGLQEKSARQYVVWSSLRIWSGFSKKMYLEVWKRLALYYHRTLLQFSNCADSLRTVGSNSINEQF